MHVIQAAWYHKWKSDLYKEAVGESPGKASLPGGREGPCTIPWALKEVSESEGNAYQLKEDWLLSQSLVWRSIIYNGLPESHIIHSI